jgi:hypothetical protein
MTLFPGKKSQAPHLIPAVYLVLAVFGTFTFVTMNLLQSVDFNEDTPISGGFFTSMYHTMDCLAEGSTVISRARGHSFFPLRSGLLRIVMPQGTHKAGTAVLFSGLRIIEQTTYLPIKNNILLKLRI